jgi:hypothetical protein
MRILLLAIVVGCLMATAAQAEHEVDHRYIVRGYVLDENQQGISNRGVWVYNGSSMLAKGTTDSSGYYSLHLHLHNTDNHQVLKLRAGEHEAELRVTFDPMDLNTARVHEANFIGSEYVEGGLGRFRMPPWLYPVAGLLVLGIILVKLEKRRKMKLKKTGSIEKSSPGSHKQKKGRRKKR